MENLLPQFLKIYPTWLICCLGGQKYVADRQIGALGLLRRYHRGAAGWYRGASRGVNQVLLSSVLMYIIVTLMLNNVHDLSKQ